MPTGSYARMQRFSSGRVTDMEFGIFLNNVEELLAERRLDVSYAAGC